MEIKTLILLNIFGNKTRFKILLSCREKEKNIYQISKELNIGYQSIYRHIDDLKRFGFIKVPEAKQKTRGKNRNIKLTKKGKDLINLLKKNLKWKRKKQSTIEGKESK